MAQQQAIHKFVLGSKELDGKTAEFLYDKGWYSITDIMGEERNVIYKSRNAQEAYMKWNVYIGRKKERSIPGNNRSENNRTDNNRAEGNRPENSRRNENRSENSRVDAGIQQQESRGDRDSRDGKDGSRRNESGGRRRSRNNRDYHRQQNESM